MLCKVLERRGSPLRLALAQPGDESGGEHEGGDFETLGADEMTAALPLGAVAELIVVLAITGEPRARAAAPPEDR